MMLNIMFDARDASMPKNFGMRLHSDTIAHSLKIIRRQQQRFAKRHPEDAGEIERLARKSGIDVMRIRMFGSGSKSGAILSNKID